MQPPSIVIYLVPTTWGEVGILRMKKQTRRLAQSQLFIVKELGFEPRSADNKARALQEIGREGQEGWCTVPGPERDEVAVEVGWGCMLTQQTQKDSPGPLSMTGKLKIRAGCRKCFTWLPLSWTDDAGSSQAWTGPCTRAELWGAAGTGFLPPLSRLLTAHATRACEGEEACFPRRCSWAPAHHAWLAEGGLDPCP